MRERSHPIVVGVVFAMTVVGVVRAEEARRDPTDAIIGLRNTDATVSKKTRRVLVILGNCTDRKYSHGRSAVEDALGSRADSLDTYYSAASNRKLGFKATVTGPYELPWVHDAAFDWHFMLNVLKDAAAECGGSPEDFDHVMGLVPSNDGSGRSNGTNERGGDADIGGPDSLIASDLLDTTVMCRMIGYNLGLRDADNDFASVFDGPGWDRSTVMGFAIDNLNALPGLNAPEKVLLDFVDVAEIATITYSGTFLIHSLNDNSARGTKILVVRTGGDDVYISFRGAAGRFDRAENLSSYYLDKIHVHTWKHPGTSLDRDVGHTRFEDAIGSGETATLSNEGGPDRDTVGRTVEVHTAWVGANRAYVDVRINETPRRMTGR